MNHINELHTQSILLAIGNNINRIDLDINNINRIKAELKEIKNNCSFVLKQLKDFI